MHPSEKYDDSSIGMIIETQESWENKKMMATKPNHQPVIVKKIRIRMLETAQVMSTLVSWLMDSFSPATRLASSCAGRLERQL